MVVKIDKKIVYPIFRVGSTSLIYSCDRKYFNREISDLKNIIVLLRDPRERFVSGLNKYCWKNKLDVDETWQEVQQGRLVDRHFAPQYTWLLHLNIFHHGTVTLMPFTHIHKITDLHKIRDKDKQKQQVVSIPDFIDVDYRLIARIGQTVNLDELIKDCRNALSKT
jgi:hypothetical protein